VSALRPVGLRCRVGEPPRSTRGVEPLSVALAERLGCTARLVGSSVEAARQPWSVDLAEAQGCLLECGGQLEDALAAGQVPLLIGGDCGIALGTLPVLHRLRPAARVLWLDAHGDFHTPASTSSGWLGGMALAGACGAWDTGLGEAMAAEQMVLCGVRSLDAGEGERLQAFGATVIGDSLETLVYLQNALDGESVYVHLDPDVIDPEVMEAEHPAPGGLSVEKLYDLLDAVADSCPIVGMEVASFFCPDDPRRREAAVGVLVRALEPLLQAQETADAH